jgi:hypothetical protein
MKKGQDAEHVVRQWRPKTGVDELGEASPCRDAAVELEAMKPELGVV